MREERAWQPFPIPGIIISILSWGRRERALTIHTTQTMRIPAKITIIHTTYPGIYVANMEICTGLQYIIDNLSGESFFGPSNSDVDNPMKM